MKDNTAKPRSQNYEEFIMEDNGFSKGWARHFPPSERRLLDVHTHIEPSEPEKIGDIIERCIKKYGLYRSSQAYIACLPILLTRKMKDRGIWSLLGYSTSFDELEPYFDAAKNCGGIYYNLFLHHENPDKEALIKAIKLGLKGIKLHNANIIVEGGDSEVWLSEKWAEIFKTIEENRLPVLWHVTQHFAGLDYIGGISKAYWREGFKKGVDYTNEDLLQVYLQIVSKYKGIPFVSAHQLFIGWERWEELFSKYPNLYTDTSVGCVIKEHDHINDEDKEYIREIFIKYSDRILYGTDAVISDSAAYCEFSGKEWRDQIQSNVRFIRELNLPYEVLHKICHKNAEKIYNLSEKNYIFTGTPLIKSNNDNEGE